MSDFTVDPAFAAGSHFAADWPLCHVRLQDDARFPWLILIPRVAGATELEHLSAADRTALMEETVRAGALVRALGDASGRPIDKLNVAAIGNVTAQLHVHVVGRRRDDGLWPDPVSGRPVMVRYEADILVAQLAQIVNFRSVHPREGGDPGFSQAQGAGDQDQRALGAVDRPNHWVPAFAGMHGVGNWPYRTSVTVRSRPP